MANKEVCIDYAKKMLVDSIWKSANIEGLNTTFPVTEDILYNRPTITRRDEVLFILNMRDAWKFVLGHLDINIDIYYLRELNKICGKDLFNQCGVVRTTNVKISGSSYVPEIPDVDTIKSDLSKLELIRNAENKAIAMFMYLCRTQIFIDGNKRLAQLIANKILIEAGIGIIDISIDCLSTFRDLLVEYYENNKPTKLFDYIKSNCIFRI